MSLSTRGLFTRFAVLVAIVAALHALVWALMGATTLRVDPERWISFLGVCAIMAAAGFIALSILRMEVLGSILLLLALGYAVGRAAIMLTYVVYDLGRDIPPWDARGGARGCGAGIPLARHARLVQRQPGRLRPARGVPSSLPAATAHRPDRHGAGGPRPRGTGCAARGRDRAPHYACLGPLHACVWSLQLLRPHCRAAPQHRARVRRADGARARARARRRRHRHRRARADGPHHLARASTRCLPSCRAGPGGSSPTCAGPAWPSTPACWRQPRCTAATTSST